MKIPSNSILARMRLIARPYWLSEHKGFASRLLFGILTLLAAASVVNVANNWVAGRFMTALAAKETNSFYLLLPLYMVTLLAIVPINVFYQMKRSQLGLSWRNWYTRHLLDRYFRNHAYLRLNKNSEVDNPDNRISQDVDTFCNMSVGLFVALLEAAVTVVAFSCVLWSISPRLMFTVVLYSLLGVAATTYIGKQLVSANFEHVRLEADLKFILSETRRNATALSKDPSKEQRGKDRALSALTQSVEVQELIIQIYRNLGFFTTGYNQLVVIIPAAIAASLYFAGSMEFGDLTRATMAFTQVFSGMTIMVQQFGAFSVYFASINRLGSFIETLDSLQEDTSSQNREGNS